MVFMSSDSGSHGNFRKMEDGYIWLPFSGSADLILSRFAAYAASKAALNMAVRVRSLRVPNPKHCVAHTICSTWQLN